MAARARWIVFRDQLRFHPAAEQAAILGEQADDDGLRAVVAELERAEPGHRGNRRRGSRSEPATVSRSRSLSQSRDSQDLAGPAPRGRRQAGPGGAYQAHCIDLPYRGRALIACAHASAAPAYFTVPPCQERTPHSSEGWLAR
jgi:hypothetical protein